MFITNTHLITFACGESGQTAQPDDKDEHRSQEEILPHQPDG